MSWRAPRREIAAPMDYGSVARLNVTPQDPTKGMPDGGNGLCLGLGDSDVDCVEDAFCSTREESIERLREFVIIEQTIYEPDQTLRGLLHPS